MKITIDMEQVIEIIKKVFGENAGDVFFNGTRAEGCSFIFVGDVWSHQVDKLIHALNEDAGGLLERNLGEWRVRKGNQNNIVNKEFPADARENCYEVRLIYKNYYGARNLDERSEATDHKGSYYINPEWD